MRSRYLIPALLLAATMAVADPIDPNLDGIGIYADLDGLANRVDVHVGTPIEVYVLITRPTGTRKLAGAEFHIDLPRNIDIWGWSYPMGGSMILSDPPDFMIVFDPIDYGAVNHVMTFIVVPTSSAPAVFYLEGHSLFPEAGGPRYLDVDYDVDPRDSDLVVLTPYPAGCDNMCFVINGAIVSGESSTWSDLKALYR